MAIDANVIPRKKAIAVVSEKNATAEVADITYLKGDPGPQGPEGPAGQDGAAATIAVGTVSTGLPGSPATVTNVGTSSAAVFDFSIPQGATGQTGADGAAATIAVGTVTTGSPGSSASVTNVGTSSAAVFDFSIPQGATGQNGQDGADGAAATIAVGTVSTGAPGSPATVTNVGTSSVAVFDFSIPEGAAGQNGQDGVGVPSGGTTGQVLKKKSGADYDTEWSNESSITRNTWYATCSTAAGTAGKEATSATADFVLAAGAMVRVKFTNSNNQTQPTLSVDGSTAKRIKNLPSENNINTQWWRAGEVIDMVYDGADFIISDGGAATASYYGKTILSNSTSSASQTTAATSKAVKDAYDLAASKSDFSGSYNDLTDKPTIPGDTKVEQMAKDPASWYYWRPLLIGYSSGASEGFTPGDATNGAYTFKTLSAQPSTGTIRAGAIDHFNGSYEAKVQADTLTADRTVTLPDKSGTVAMTTDIPSPSSATPQDLGTAAAGSSTDYSRADHVHTKPTYTKSDVGLSNVDNVQQYSSTNPPPYPVTSVNTQTGDVSLSIPATAADVGALPDDTKYAASASVGGPATMANAIHWGACDNTSTATAFTAQIPGITSYYEGLTIVLRNGVVASTTNCTLNINSLGALPIYPSTSDTRVSTAYAKAYTMIFVYTETKITGVPCWEMQYGMAYSNSIGYQVRTNSMKLPASDKFYRYRLLFQSADGQSFVPANTSTSTNAIASRTTNTRPIDPFGLIVYYGSTTAISAGSSPGATVLWQQYVFTLGYSFNNTGAALTLTANDPVYLRCTPNADGSAVMDYFTQTLPSTEDGKIYIFLGVAVDATTVELNIAHPVYYYKGSAIRLWTNAAATSGPSPSDATPQALGTAAAGTSNDYSRADHVHEKPTYSASDVGAIATPASPTVGDFLVYTNNGWDAMTLSTWQGGNY